MAIKYLDTKRIRGSSTAGSSDTLGTAGNAVSNDSALVTSGHKLGTGCLDFDGSEKIVGWNDTNVSGLQNAMDTAGSISMWFNADQEEDSILIAFCQTNANTKMEVTTRPNRKLGAQLKIGGTQKWEVTSDTLYNGNGNWNHVVLTHNGTLAEIYINGSLATMTRGNTTDNSLWWTALRNTGANGIAIGSKAPLNGASHNEFFEGKLDDIGIWDRALTSSEVGDLYNSGTGALATTIPSGLKVYYSCDSATVTNEAVVVDEKTTLVTAAVTPTRQSSNMDSVEFATVSSDKFQFTLPSTATTMPSTSTGYGGDTMTFDLGSALSDTAWVARCKVTFTTMDLNDTDASMNGFGFWISDTANGNVDVGSQDWASIVGMRAQNADGNTSTGAMMGSRIRDSNQPETHFSTGDSNCPLVGTSAFSATTYYIQTTRDGDDLITTIGTDAYGGTTGGGTQTVPTTGASSSNVTGLRYLKFTVFTEFRSAGDPDGTVIGNIDDFSIDDGVTTYATADITQAALLSGSSDLPENTLFEETDSRVLYWLQSGKWNPPTNRGVFNYQDELEYINPLIAANATVFGSTGIANTDGSATGGNATYGAVCGISSSVNDIARWTFATLGSSVNWGNLNTNRKDCAGCSNDTRMVISGGDTGGGVASTDMVELNSSGTASNFKDVYSHYGGGSFSSATRAVVGGGYTGALSGTSNQYYMAFATGGSASSSGSLSGSTRFVHTGASNSTTGLYAGGYEHSDYIQKMTIASLGTGVSWGELSVGRHNLGAVSTEAKVVFGAGQRSSGLTGVMDQKNFDNDGNCTTFGDLSFAGTCSGVSDMVRT